MIRRWYRALARTLSSGQPLHKPSPRRQRTLLRLEAVEDRTVASAVAFDLPHAPVHVADQSNSTNKQSDEQDAATGDGTAVQHTDEFLFTGAPDAEPILNTGDADVARSEVDFPTPSPHIQAALGKTFANESIRVDEVVVSAKQVGDGEQPAPVKTAAATDIDGVVTSKSDFAPSALDRSAAVDREARSPADTAMAVSRANVPTDRPSGVLHAAAESAPATNRGNGDLLAAPNRSIPAGRGNGEVVVGNQVGRLPSDLSDATLLQRFVAHREQAAFTALVQRHGSLVFGVCQRVLGDFHAAQDASQATFVILARKAGMLDRNSPLGGWLYRVAYHLALRSRAVNARQRAVDSEAGEVAVAQDAGDSAVDLEQRELQQVVREELQSLPEKYRTPLTLCYFDGQSHADAARSIGVPRGSMGKRIGEGLDRLRERLLHRGFAL
jgi:RNA polymerase sigma factor (sigma-70 family)